MTPRATRDLAIKIACEYYGVDGWSDAKELPYPQMRHLAAYLFIRSQDASCRWTDRVFGNYNGMARNSCEGVLKRFESVKGFREDVEEMVNRLTSSP